MSRHINLYDPALLRQREWFTAANLSAVAAMLLVIVVAWGAWVRSQAADLEAQAAALGVEVKSLQEQSVVIGGQLAGRKPDPKLERELVALRGRLGTRSQIAEKLSEGLAPQSGGYADYLRGLARQTPSGLWLTGFSVGAGGQGMEIRGRTLDPALLPEYIRRLNAEKAFQGRSFAALQVSVAPVVPVAAGAAATAPTLPYHEFSLVPAKAAVTAGAASGARK
jgi:hypothetical protein